MGVALEAVGPLPVKILVVVLVIVGLGTACDGGDGDNETNANRSPTTTTTNTPDQDAGDFMKEITEQSIRGQYGRVWETLHPAHQSIVTREKFDARERDDGDTGGTQINVEVVETYEEPVAIKGTDETADSTAVTLRFGYRNPLTGNPAEEHQTVHAVPVRGEWKWILAPSTFDAYAKGECPPD